MDRFRLTYGVASFPAFTSHAVPVSVKLSWTYFKFWFDLF